MSRRILHVLVGLRRGGIETWLVNALRQSPHLRANSAICLVGSNQTSQGDYSSQIRAWRIPLFQVRFSRVGVPFVLRFQRLLRDLQPKIVHSHLNYMSGWVTLAAYIAGVPQRIAHYHTTLPLSHNRTDKRLYMRALRSVEGATETLRLGCSQATLRSYASHCGRTTDKDHVLYYGIDLQPFRHAARSDSCAFRSELQLPAEALVVGHVGRFAPQKNHAFILRVFAEIARTELRAHLLLVGDGPLRPAIEAQARCLGLSERVTFTGPRADVPRLMRSAMDVLMLPSLWEGLPVTLLEAQAAGLRCLVSDIVTDEVDTVPDLIRRLSLDSPPEHWARALLHAVSREPSPNRRGALALLESSAFNIANSTQRLEAIYGF